MRFFELFVVLAFAAAWGIVALVARRYDKPRNEPPLPPASHSADQNESH